MRTFYDFRTQNWKDPKKFPIQGKVILKWKDKWLIKLYNDPHIVATNFNSEYSSVKYIVVPCTIYLYNVYLMG
jgi:hypothetical protein